MMLVRVFWHWQGIRQMVSLAPDINGATVIDVV